MLDDLLVERVFTEDYRAAEVNVEILERYRAQVFLVKPTQSLKGWPKRPTITKPLKVVVIGLGEEPSLQRNLRPDPDRRQGSLKGILVYASWSILSIESLALSAVSFGTLISYTMSLNDR
jgi:hypothetical protein